MDKLEQVKKEIERRRDIFRTSVASIDGCKANVLTDILSFIDSLQEEPHCDERQFDELSKLQEGIGQIAKAVYEHKGKENPTVEKIREILIENSFDRMEIRGEISKKEEPVSKELDEAAWQYYDRNKPLMPPELDLHKELIDFFKAGARWKEQNDSNLSEVLVRDNLDEMAEEYSSCTYLEEVLGEGDREVLKARLNNTFKAGAKWKEEQMTSKGK